MSQHQQRPRDILEFLRRASSDDAEVEVAPPEAAPAPPPPVESPHVTVSSGDAPMVVMRRSQVVVAGVAGGLLVLLAFLIGLANGESSPEELAAAAPTTFYTIKVIEYPDTKVGKIYAKTLAADIERLGLEEVTIETLDRDRKLVVALGSWLKNPRENRHAVELLSKIQSMPVKGYEKPPFKDAYFFAIKR